MKTAIVVLALVAAISVTANAAGLPPWEFGMSKSQVTSLEEFGPYKTFSNGDLESYNYRWHGQKVNVQFFFRGDRLRRIGIYLYEGTDPKGGIPALRNAYEALEKDYGKVIVPEMKVGRGSEPLTAEGIAIGAAVDADITGEARMMPAKQPRDMRVFARTFTGMVQGRKWYYVVVNYDPNA